MISKEQFSQYKNQSYFLKLKELAASKEADPYSFKMIFFGGTGAVGGQAVIEVLQGYQFINRNRTESSKSRPELVITGIDLSQINQFCTKIFQVFGAQSFQKINEDENNPTYLFENYIELNFQCLMASPEFKTDLQAALSQLNSAKEKIDFLKKEASHITAPFEDFVEQFKKDAGLEPDHKIKAVFSGIPIPSVATYHFEAIDRLLEEHELGMEDSDKQTERSIKREILKGLASDFGDIKRKHSEEVLIAHTTSVGGMYQIIDGEAVIKLGYAHSSLGNLLKEKQFYANVLTIQYSNFGLKSLVTSAAIGIDYIYQTSTLPLSSGVSRKFRMAAEKGTLPFDIGLSQDKRSGRLLNKIFKAVQVPHQHPVNDKQGEAVSKEKLNFVGKNDKVKNLHVQYALRSGENGLFSLDNAYALYLNMKIASQEELAHVLVYNAFFGDDEQKPWFDKHGICYYTQTDNSSLVFALLNNRREFRTYQTSAFTVKAFQELGSSKHQCELHTSALFILLHKLKHLGANLISREITSRYTASEVIEFVDRNSPTLLLEDVLHYGKNLKQLTIDFAELFELDSAEQLEEFMGFEGNPNGFVKTFFSHLFSVVKETISSITSLGTPIIYTNKKGEDMVLSGPYFAPLDLLISENFSLINQLEGECKKYKLNQSELLNWVICNNGVADMRAGAVVNTAKTYKEGLKDALTHCSNAEEFREVINALKKRNGRNLKENYHYNSSGLLAYTQRIAGLHEQLSTFDLSLGTLNGWKALFPVDSNNNHPLVPGLVEAMRMYSEGLGKITGTEFLYPRYGYFE